MYAAFQHHMPKNFKVTKPFPTDSELKLSLCNKDGTCNRPPPEEIRRNLELGYRTGIGMLLWLQRNTKIDASTGIAFLSRNMAAPSDKAFYCMLHLMQWLFQTKDKGLRFHANKDIKPLCWYDASDDRDPIDSITIGGGLITMMGAAVCWNANKLLHVGNAGSSHAEYMQLERTTRSVVWLRSLLQAAQIFRACGDGFPTINFNKLTRLHAGSPVFIDATTTTVLKWIIRHEGVLFGTDATDDADAMGRWAIITEQGTADIMAIAADCSPRGQPGPTAGATWMTYDDDGMLKIHDTLTVLDVLRLADIVGDQTIMIGDNINALKWASTDAVTPGNKHVRTAYHWIKEHVRDGDIDLRDGPSALNLADFLTKNLAGPPIQSASDAASGYIDAPIVPPRRITYD
jgi:hypothetical protein